MKIIVCLSLIANGLMAGLIAGHILSAKDNNVCRCEHRRRIGDEPIDRGPFPTGWVVPDEMPKPKPSGDAP